MGKKAFSRRLAENEAAAVASSIRVSPRKLNLVAGMIRGKDVEPALTDLAFCKRRIAGHVKKVLQSAVANAENNHQLDVDRLFVAEAHVGRALVLRRFRARARGRVGRLRKPTSNLTIVVREREEAD
ncbi:MAG: 50S ribosomal protein L22 [Alphaproteobacteria bacterium]|nr:50S ribosomal protein L22 [Alphaproteobacteria bacterium]